MFIVEAEKQLFSLKPMNCPESTFIYRSHLRSYRDLPLRFNEYGRLHRNERSGTLSGLTRVRQFIQDDAHLYVRPDQLTDEIQALLGEVREAYGWFGLEPRFAFATKPDKALGDPALWERAEQLIREAFAAADITYDLKPKDGTFYAPKIDIYIDDALGREWQMATIQVDLVMLPERFDLTYIDEDRSAAAPDGHPSRDLRLAGTVHRHPHRALRRRLPALDRPGPGGRHPDRRPPRRRRPRAGRASCAARGLRVEVDDSSNRMQYKIRAAQEQKVPYMLVLGDREIEARPGDRPRERGAATGCRPGDASAGTSWRTGWRRSRAARGGGLQPAEGAEARQRLVGGRLCYPPPSAERGRIAARRSANRSNDKG